MAESRSWFTCRCKRWSTIHFKLQRDGTNIISTENLNGRLLPSFVCIENLLGPSPPLESRATRQSGRQNIAPDERVRPHTTSLHGRPSTHCDERSKSSSQPGFQKIIRCFASTANTPSTALYKMFSNVDNTKP